MQGCSQLQGRAEGLQPPRRCPSTSTATAPQLPVAAGGMSWASGWRHKTWACSQTCAPRSSRRPSPECERSLRGLAPWHPSPGSSMGGSSIYCGHSRAASCSASAAADYIVSTPPRPGGQLAEVGLCPGIATRLLRSRSAPRRRCFNPIDIIKQKLQVRCLPAARLSYFGRLPCALSPPPSAPPHGGVQGEAPPLVAALNPEDLGTRVSEKHRLQSATCCRCAQTAAVQHGRSIGAMEAVRDVYSAQGLPGGWRGAGGRAGSQAVGRGPSFLERASSWHLSQKSCCAARLPAMPAQQPC